MKNTADQNLQGSGLPRHISVSGERPSEAPAEQDVFLFSVLVTLWSVSSGSLAGEQRVCCDGVGRLASAQARRLHGGAEIEITHTHKHITGFISLTQRLLFEVGTLQAIFGSSSACRKQRSEVSYIHCQRYVTGTHHSVV